MIVTGYQAREVRQPGLLDGHSCEFDRGAESRRQRILKQRPTDTYAELRLGEDVLIIGAAEGWVGGGGADGRRLVTPEGGAEVQAKLLWLKEEGQTFGGSTARKPLPKRKYAAERRRQSLF